MSGLYFADMGALSAAYEAWMKRKALSANTIRQRVRFQRLVRRELGDITELTTEDLMDWLAEFSGWTRATYFTGLLSMFDWMIDDGLRVGHPLRGGDLRRPVRPDPAPKPLTPAEESLALVHATGDLATWLLLGLRQGLRAHEIAKVQGSDVNQQHLRVLGKGGKEALLPTHPDIWTLAQSYPARGYWFPSKAEHLDHVTGKWVGMAVSTHFGSLGITGSIHRTRATYGTRLVQQGTSLHLVQKLMRHSSLQSTQHYLGTTYDELAAAIGQLGRVAA